MRRLAIALLAAGALASCGGGEGSDERPAAAPDTTRLTVQVTEAGPDPIAIELRCGGAEPCDRAQLDALATLAEPPDPDQACTLQYGGPETAHVTGMLDAEPVDVTISRTDGCGIADYEALFDALGRRPPLAG